jgi:hypothetical protein
VPCTNNKKLHRILVNFLCDAKIGAVTFSLVPVRLLSVQEGSEGGSEKSMKQKGMYFTYISRLFLGYFSKISGNTVYVRHFFIK